MRIELMTLKDEPMYEALSASCEESLLYTSLQYRDFLKAFLPQAKDCYLVAIDGMDMIGALPAFSFTGEYGTVINSLPFYGSNGGVIVHPKASDSRRIKTHLIFAFQDLALQRKAVASTIITSPYETDLPIYEETSYTAIDERIGQISCLPNHLDHIEDIDQLLLEQYHYKTRNMVRKAQKQAMKVHHAEDNKILETLCQIHTDNMNTIGGRAKPWSFFCAVRDHFRYGDQYRVYFAEFENKIVAALLLIYYNKTVEYYTPAIVAEYRSLQPLSAIIHKAMHDACLDGYRYWNWGGTWKSQDGVYLFKNRWGAADKPYRYYITENTQFGSFRHLKKEVLEASYPMFYTIPYACLEE